MAQHPDDEGRSPLFVQMMLCDEEVESQRWLKLRRKPPISALWANLSAKWMPSSLSPVEPAFVDDIELRDMLLWTLADQSSRARDYSQYRCIRGKSIAGCACRADL